MRQTHITQRYSNKNMRYNNSEPKKLKKITSKKTHTNKNVYVNNLPSHYMSPCLDTSCGGRWSQTSAYTRACHTGDFLYYRLTHSCQ